MNISPPSPTPTLHPCLERPWQFLLTINLRSAHFNTNHHHHPVNVNGGAPGYKWFMPGTGTSPLLSALTGEQWSQPPNVSFTSVAVMSICSIERGCRARYSHGLAVVTWFNIHHGSLQSPISRLDCTSKSILDSPLWTVELLKNWDRLEISFITVIIAEFQKIVPYWFYWEKFLWNSAVASCTLGSDVTL